MTNATRTTAARIQKRLNKGMDYNDLLSSYEFIESKATLGPTTRTTEKWINRKNGEGFIISMTISSTGKVTRSIYAF